MWRIRGIQKGYIKNLMQIQQIPKAQDVKCVINFVQPDEIFILLQGYQWSQQIHAKIKMQAPKRMKSW